MGVRSLPQRTGPALMTLVGIAGVVAALLVVLSMAVGLETVMRVSAADDAVVVLRVGSENEMASSIDVATARAISEAPGIAQGDDELLLSAEAIVVVDVPSRSTGRR